MVFMGCSSLDISISSVSLVLEMFKQSDEKSPYHMGHIICLKTVNPNTDSDWDLLQWVGMNWIIILFMVLIIFISSLFPCRLCHPFWSLFSRHPCLPFFSKVRIKLLVGLYIAFSAYIGIYLAKVWPWYMKIRSINETFLSFPPPPPILPEQTTAAMIPIITTPLIYHFILEGWNYNIIAIGMTNQIRISIASWIITYDP